MGGDDYYLSYINALPPGTYYYVAYEVEGGMAFAVLNSEGELITWGRFANTED